MGIRINTAIGWGMPFEDFQRHQRVGLPAEYGDGWSEALEAALAGTGDMGGPYGRSLPITDVATTAFDLVRTVGYDHCSHVILHGGIDEARQWHRRDDDIDYALLRGADDTPPDDRVEYLARGHHPYRDLRMDAAGAPVRRPTEDDDARNAFDADGTLLPGVPDRLRWWLGRSGLLDVCGLAALRPLRAVWWS